MDEVFYSMKDIIMIGDGLGCRTFTATTLGMQVIGTDISKYAVEHCNQDIKDKYFIDDIVNTNLKEKGMLVVAYDILEHLKYEDLNKAIKNIIEASKKYILISVPFKGTPNCENDPTHIIKESRDWWVKQFTLKGLKEVEVPGHFLFKEQLLIFEK